jgi:secondary thiamine-phosphate synthase enzyme
MVFGRGINIQTKGNSDIIDVTEQVETILAESGVKNGIVCVSVVGSTASVSTIEYETALTTDFQEYLEQAVPSTKSTRHGDTWGDDNGFSHIRATMMGPGITIPVHKGKLVLGTWQQIVVIDHDNRPRGRAVFVQVMGE